jgi:excisionase family DNA binding protein
MPKFFPDDDALVRPTKAAAFLDVTRQHVYQLLDRGVLKGVRVGGSTRIPVSELRKFSRARAGQSKKKNGGRHRKNGTDRRRGRKS